ncbi:MAG: helix-turn-helix domain-containing protein [Bacteroides sp.]|nr:helix-turn-helix domain-containing protein [Bacteroides sp.]
MTEVIYTKRNERIKLFFSRCMELKEALGHIRDNWRPILNNDTFLTDAEVANRLRVTRRTLHEYRDQGLIPYYAIGGKYIYSERDVSKVLMDNYRRIEE